MTWKFGKSTTTTEVCSMAVTRWIEALCSVVGPNVETVKQASDC